MSVPDPGYLFNLSIVAITFVGFSAIVVILRQSLGNPFQPLDSLAARLFMIWGFTIAFAAMLPILLSQFRMPAEAGWFVCGIVAGLFTGAINVVYPIVRPRIVGIPNSLHIWLHVAFGLLVAGTLLIDAFRPFPDQAGGIYALALTLYMGEASFAFVQHFGLMLSEAKGGR